MTQLFQSYFLMALEASIVILIVLVLRPFFRKYSKLGGEPVMDRCVLPASLSHHRGRAYPGILERVVSKGSDSRASGAGQSGNTRT